MQGNKGFLDNVPGTMSILLLACLVTKPAAANEPTLADGRALAQSFGAELQNALRAAIADGGPVAGITVCKDRAPQIAAELSRRSGAKVSRVSRRFRNPNNAPESWQREVLDNFESDMNEGKPSPEYLEHKADGTRYMKAIPTQPVCLACHGASLTGDVRAALDEAYPHDRARGYALDELRGAFSITWPAQEED